MQTSKLGRENNARMQEATKVNVTMIVITKMRDKTCNIIP